MWLDLYGSTKRMKLSQQYMNIEVSVFLPHCSAVEVLALVTWFCYILDLLCVLVLSFICLVSLPCSEHLESRRGLADGKYLLCPAQAERTAKHEKQCSLCHWPRLTHWQA